jgi:hypothetical protein
MLDKGGGLQCFLKNILYNVLGRSGTTFRFLFGLPYFFIEVNFYHSLHASYPWSTVLFLVFEEKNLKENMSINKNYNQLCSTIPRKFHFHIKDYEFLISHDAAKVNLIEFWLFD